MLPEDVRHWKAKLSVPKVAASERLSAYSVGQWPEKKEQAGGVARSDMLGVEKGGEDEEAVWSPFLYLVELVQLPPPCPHVRSQRWLVLCLRGNFIPYLLSSKKHSKAHTDN